VSVDFCYCDVGSSPYFTRWVKPSKVRRCMECGGKIGAGERSFYTTGKCEGDWWSGYTCAKCQELIEYVMAHVPCLCYTHGDAWGQESGSFAESNLGMAVEYAAKELPGFAFSVGRRFVAIYRAKP
jgi:hypothetical protein